MTSKAKLIYECNESLCYVGNFTHKGAKVATGIKNKDFKGILVIPKYHNRIPIKYIGYCAFYECTQITDIIIEARIEGIFNYGFGHMPNLQSINVPSTCTFIESQGIYSYNTTSSPNATGSLMISFEPNSQMQKINKNAFGRKERIVLIMCNKIDTLKDANKIYIYCANFQILSNDSFTLGSINSTVIKGINCLHDMELSYRFLKLLPHTCFVQRRQATISLYLSILLLSS